MHLNEASCSFARVSLDLFEPVCALLEISLRVLSVFDELGYLEYTRTRVDFVTAHVACNRVFDDVTQQAVSAPSKLAVVVGSVSGMC